MLGGYKIIFAGKNLNYEQLICFLKTYFQYELFEKNNEEGSLYSKYYFTKPGFPDIQVIIERGYLEIDIKVENNFWSISNVYKYLHHKEIVRGRYSSDKDLLENFENETKNYLNEIFINWDTISNDRLEKFYKEFPQYVFVWINGSVK